MSLELADIPYIQDMTSGSSITSCVPVVISVVSNSLQPYELQPSSLFSPWDSPGKNTRVGYHALLQGIFPTQGLNPWSPVAPVLAHRFFTTKQTEKPHR